MMLAAENSGPKPQGTVSAGKAKPIAEAKSPSILDNSWKLPSVVKAN